MSYMVGLIENTESPISYYLNDRPDPGQATCSIMCHATSREEKLDLLSLVNQQVPHLLTSIHVQENEEDLESSATHVVTSVFYGVEIYCILAQDIDAGDEERKEIEKNLIVMANKWIEALNEFEEPLKFQKRFNSQEKHLMTQLRCRLYANLQTQPMIECSYLDSYIKSFEVLQTLFTFTEDLRNSKAVPIAIQLCPLNAILAENDAMAKLTYRDVDFSLVDRVSRLLSELNKVIISAEKIYEANITSFDSDSLPEFLGLVSKFQGFLKSKLKQSVMVARSSCDSSDSAVSSFLQDVERHLLFKPSELKLWLKCKTEEMDIVDWMEKTAGTGIDFLSKDKLENHLKNSLDYSVVFIVPGERTSAILADMKHCAFNLEEFWFCYAEHAISASNDDQSWYNIPVQKKLVLQKIQQLATHVERNKKITKQVNYIVSFIEGNKPFTCSYSVYQGDKLIKDKIFRLPDAPTGLRLFSLPVPSAKTREAKRAKSSTSSVRLQWDYEILGYSFTFVAEYRSAGSPDSWIQRKTNKKEVVISFETGTDIEIRVAAQTCIGQSEFSESIATKSTVESSFELDIPSVLLPPTGLKVKSVTSQTAELEWITPPDKHLYFDLRFRVDYWEKGQDPDDDDYKEYSYSETPRVLHYLLPETTYCITISTVTADGSKKSEPCAPVEFTTGKVVRYAETFAQQNKKSENEVNTVYSVPLIESKGRLKTAQRFAFGNKMSSKTEMGEPRTILLVGASDSGKTSLINAMINCVFDVEWEDPFRFQLIDEQDDGQMDRIRVYDIHHTDGFLVDYSLTIIDTPSYVEDDPTKNMAITEIISDFINDQNGIQQVDMVGFVMDSSVPELSLLQFYIYSSLIKIFGNDIKENLKFLLTSAENEDPFLWSDVVDYQLVTYGPFKEHEQNWHRFNSNAILTFKIQPGAMDSQCFEEWMKNLADFFNYSLDDAKTKSVAILKQLNDEQNRLDVTVGGLLGRMKTEAARLEELRETNRMMYYAINYNDDIELQLNVTVRKSYYLPFGIYSNNCDECQMTCHLPCGLKDNTENYECDSMDHSLPEETRTCRVCPGKCSWKVHSRQEFAWYCKQEAETTTSGAIKQKYESKLNKNLTSEELMGALNGDFAEKKKDLVVLIETVLRHIRQLNQIVRKLYSNPQMPCGEAGRYAHDVIIQLIGIEQNVNPLLPLSPDQEKRIDALRKLGQLTSPYYTQLRGGLERNEQESWAVLDSDISELFSAHPDEEGPMDEEEGPMEM